MPTAERGLLRVPIRIRLPAGRWSEGVLPVLGLPVLALAAILSGGSLHAVGAGRAGDLVWAGGTAAILVPLTWSVGRSLARRDVGVDAIALLAMATALALGEYLAGAVVALMLAGGNTLEAYAAGRARRELRALVDRAPRHARRRTEEGYSDVPVEEVEVGDVVLVRGGEVVPVDGLVLSEEAVVDEAALTGEPLPVTWRRGHTVRSGSANAGDAFEARALRPAAESAYAALVRLVRSAEAQRAPFVRLADRYAAAFLPLTVAVATIAWAASGDPVRALAVLVVATPCPLILAAPIAFLAGISRAARVGVIVKGSRAVEKLGEARSVLLDKTGTLTLGTPELERVTATDGMAADDVLRLGASLDLASAHSLADALVRGARTRGLALSIPTEPRETPGEGVEGVVDGRRVAVGSVNWVRARGYDGVPPTGNGGAGSASVAIGVDGRLAGVALVGDRVRLDADTLLDSLREAGIAQIALVTGDHAAAAEEVGARIGADRVFADRTPEGKLDVVRALQAKPELSPVVMVGDGVNDAPALALADVGIAMGTAGATVASETADAVIVVNRIDRVADAIRIGRRSLGIARQSVLAGIGLSVVAMGFAAAGFIPPVAGALLQEVIDVGVIANALRALR